VSQTQTLHSALALETLGVEIRRALTTAINSEGELSPRTAWVALGLVALGGWLLRCFPLLRVAGPLGFPIDYDEGVYFSASALLFDGVLPYRDFVFVHPPGLLYLLGPIAAFVQDGAADAGFALSRYLATAVGAANILLVGRLTWRWTGPAGGLFAAALYATYPDIVSVERGPFLEPMLNLACLSFAALWLREPFTGRKAFIAGLVLGVAATVKIWAGIWFLAALCALPAPKVRHLAALVGGGAVAFVVLVGPLAAMAPDSFLSQTVLFHGARPSDGAARSLRFESIFSWVSSTLALVGLAAWAERRQRPVRFFAAAYLLTWAAFFASSAYWTQYNAHLAASESVLAGAGAGFLWHRVRRRLRAPLAAHAALTLLVLAVAFPGARLSGLRGRARAGEQLALGKALKALPADACLFAFEPAWGVLGGRLPQGAPLIVDSYAQMLGDALPARTTEDWNVNRAFDSPASQATIRQTLERCRYAVMGWRGWWQLSEENERWVRASHTPLPVPGAESIDIWERKP
jgi:hypothetical protein